MKNLANCKPSEFLKQTNRIRKSVANWLSITNVMEIRKRRPTIEKGMSDEEIKKARENQIHDNMMSLLDSILDEHPQETLELLALLCFVEPKDVDKHPISEYLQSFSELISNQSVVSFFISLAQLDLRTT